MSLNDLIKEGYWPTDSVPTLPITSGLEFYLDASVKQSVDVPNQLWRNLVASPASGAAQSDYDFQMGANTTAGDSDEPLHVGTATGGHGNAYWNMGGDDQFQIASNTSFLDQLQDNGAVWTFCLVYEAVDNSTKQELFTTRSAGSGIKVRQLPDQTIDFQPENSGNNVIFVSNEKININSRNVILLSVSENGGNNGSFFSINNVVDSFNAEHNSNTDQNAQRAAKIFESSGDATKIGTKGVATVMFNRAISQTEASLLYNHFVNRGYL